MPVMVLRGEAAALLASALVLAGIVLAAPPAGRLSRILTPVLGALPVASLVLGVTAVVSGSPDRLALVLLFSCIVAVLALAHLQARRLGRQLLAARDNLRRARLTWQLTTQRRPTRGTPRPPEPTPSDRPRQR
jgi:hypothetical protein